MSLRRPGPQDVQSPPRLLDVLAGFYDALAGLTRDVSDSLVTVTFAAATTDVQVAHGLGHAVTQWWVVDSNAAATVWQSSTENTAPDRYLLLQASAPVTVKVRLR